MGRLDRSDRGPLSSGDRYPKFSRTDDAGVVGIGRTLAASQAKIAMRVTVFNSRGLLYLGLIWFAESFWGGGGAAALGAEVLSVADQRHELFRVFSVEDLFDQFTNLFAHHKLRMIRSSRGYSGGAY